MPLVPTRRVARRFRGLSTDRKLAFLADVWDARGFETTVDGDVVVASRDGDAVRIGVVEESPVRRLRSGVLRSLVGAGSDGSRGVDVLVDVRDTRLRRLLGGSPDPDGRRLPPAELRELLAYGLDRADGDRLAREYLDTPLVVEGARPSPSGSAVSSRSGGSAALLALATIAAVLLVIVVTGGPTGVPGYDLSDAADGSADTDAVDGSTGTDAVDGSAVLDGGDTTPTDTGSDLPPGLSLSGVDDAERLAHAHRRSLPTSRTLEIDFRGPPDAIGFQGIVATNTTWEAETSIRYRSETHVTFADRNGSRTEENGSEQNGSEGTPRTRTVAVFADGDREYVGIRDGSDDPGGTGSFDEYRVSRAGSFFSATDTPSATRVARYLNSNGTRLSVATDRTDTRYVVVATEPPAGLPDTVESYRARAVVRPDGVVTRLAVTYDRTDANRTVRYEQRLSKLGRTTAGEPAWVEEAREERREG